MNYIIVKMEKDNLHSVTQLLNEANLPSEDISEHLNTFLVAKLNDKIIGAVGLELRNDKALLRSLVVKEKYRSLGIGKELYKQCIEFAKQNNVTEVGLLTTTAEGFFAKQGFEEITQENIPEFIKQTKEFQIYCPVNSTVMIKYL